MYLPSVPKLLLLFLFCMTFLMSCDRPECNNQNPVFDSEMPTSQAYQTELAEQLESYSKDDLRYWLKSYEAINGEEYLHFNVQGGDLCAIMVLEMPHWDRIEFIRERKAVGSRGAEFTNLQYQVVRDSLGTHFIYQSHGRIID